MSGWVFAEVACLTAVATPPYCERQEQLAFDQLLAAVYRGAAAPLLDLLHDRGRVGITIDDPRLTGLPFETAHDGLGPALFEHVLTFRTARVRTGGPDDGRSRSTFDRAMAQGWSGHPSSSSSWDASTAIARRRERTDWCTRLVIGRTRRP